MAGRSGTDIKLPDEKTRFSANLVALIDYLAKLASYLQQNGHKVPNPVLVSLGKEVIAKYDKDELIKLIRTRSIKYWDRIYSCDEAFFMKEADQIFSLTSNDDYKIFSTLFQMKNRDGSWVISKENRSAIWRFLHSLIRICIKYSVKDKSPGIEDHAKKWDVKL